MRTSILLAILILSVTTLILVIKGLTGPKENRDLLPLAVLTGAPAMFLSIVFLLTTNINP